MNFQLDKIASKSNVFSPKGVGNKPFDVGASYLKMENQEEIWKNILGFEGLYQVSNLGNVKSLKRFIPRGKKGDLRINEKIIRFGSLKHDKRYKTVSLWKANKGKTILAHRVVAASFLPNPKNKATVNHKDGNPSNNSVENLEWATNTENQIHSFRELGRRSGRIVPTIKISLDGMILETYESRAEAAKQNNVNHSMLVQCCKGKIESLHGYKYL